MGLSLRWLNLGGVAPGLKKIEILGEAILANSETEVREEYNAIDPRFSFVPLGLQNQ